MKSASYNRRDGESLIGRYFEVGGRHQRRSEMELESFDLRGKVHHRMTRVIGCKPTHPNREEDATRIPPLATVLRVDTALVSTSRSAEEIEADIVAESLALEMLQGICHSDHDSGISRVRGVSFCGEA